MAETVLLELGLTRAQSVVYTALLEADPAQVGELIRKTGLQNSVVHLTLGALVAKGLASYHREGRYRIYHAADPRMLLERLDQQKTRLKSFLNEVAARRKKSARNEAQVFHGLGGFKAAHFEMIDGLRKGSEWLFLSFKSLDSSVMTEVHQFYAEFEGERSHRGITVRGVAPKSWAPYYQGRKRSSILLVDVPMLHNINICADRVILTPWDDGETTFLIFSHDLAAHFKNYFNDIWNRFR